jgi:hypothetical protein
MKSDRQDNASEVDSAVEKMMRSREQEIAVSAAPAVAKGADIPQNFVLYHRDRSQCTGSQEILSKIDVVKEDFLIIDVATLEGNMPQWLNGTPLLVDNRTEAREIYRGTEALDFIKMVYDGIVKE